MDQHAATDVVLSSRNNGSIRCFMLLCHHSHGFLWTNRRSSIRQPLCRLVHFIGVYEIFPAKCNRVKTMVWSRSHAFESTTEACQVVFRSLQRTKQHVRIGHQKEQRRLEGLCYSMQVYQYCLDFFVMSLDSNAFESNPWYDFADTPNCRGSPFPLKGKLLDPLVHYA